MRTLNIRIVPSVLAIGVSACVSQNGEKEVKGKISVAKQITAEQFVERYEQDSDLFVLDVRQPEELKGALRHLPRVINIPLGECGRWHDCCTETKTSKAAESR